MAENKKTIPFSPPDITDLEIDEVVAALRSGWITTGPRTKQLEKNIAQWVGTEKCVCLNSQTARERCRGYGLNRALLGLAAERGCVAGTATDSLTAYIEQHIAAVTKTSLCCCHIVTF